MLVNELITLSPDEIHIWHTSIPQWGAALNGFRDIISENERERSEKYRFPHDKQRFVIARGLLRNILASYVDIPPERISFAYNQYGKPSLSNVPTGGTVHFNLSHSHDVVLYAVAGASIGIDIERVRHDLDVEGIAERFFSKMERDHLRRLPSEVRHQAFFTCWTRKEAYIKAKGNGLSLALDSFSVPLSPQDGLDLIEAKEAPEDIHRWRFRQAGLYPGFASAIAIERPADASKGRGNQRVIYKSLNAEAISA